MTVKRQKAVEIFMTLNLPGLKVKHLSATSYVDYLAFKRPLKKYIDDLTQAEQELIKEYGDAVTIQNGRFHSEDKGFFEKLAKIQEPEFEAAKLNFIPMAEFKPWVDELSAGEADILAEYLLQG